MGNGARRGDIQEFVEAAEIEHADAHWNNGPARSDAQMLLVYL
jgi:hypothetical protein